ncbi:MAG TPA: hypothetical protein VMR25_05975 [Planctomycetaceae bacterium]|nr:hypothetical protein [Planctomycetaceae bacterium]
MSHANTGRAVRSRPHVLRFEHKRQPLASRRLFARRLAGSFALSTTIVTLSLLGGMAGYHHFERMAWIDAFVNASMILSGMGPLGSLQTWNGKAFAGLYALYSGLVLILAMGIVIAPIVHRVLHRFNLEAESEK